MTVKWIKETSDTWIRVPTSSAVTYVGLHADFVGAYPQLAQVDLGAEFASFAEESREWAESTFVVGSEGFPRD